MYKRRPKDLYSWLCQFDMQDRRVTVPDPPKRFLQRYWKDLSDDVRADIQKRYGQENQQWRYWNGLYSHILGLSREG